MKLYNADTEEFILELPVEIFISQGGEEHYSVLYKEENLSEIHSRRTLRYEFNKEEISSFATNHIYNYYPIWKQQNIISFGSDEEKQKMNQFIQLVISWTDSSNPQLFDGSLEKIIP